MEGAKKGLPSGPDNPLRRSARWTRARRETSLAVLRATGNARAAAEAVGMDRTTLEHRYRNDAAFAADWDSAVAAADARLRAGPPADLDPFELVRRGPNGKLQIVAAGKGRWNARIEALFLAELRRTGNISGSARAAGFTPETIWERRRRWPGFARAMDAVLEETEIELEFRLARLGNNVAADESEIGTVAEVGTVPVGTVPLGTAAREPPFDPEFALKFLKWREEKRNGRGRRGRGDRYHRPEPSIEEVRDEIIARVARIRAHRDRQAGGGTGGSGDDGAAGDSPELPVP